jgi:hypothetical protein
VEVDPLLTHHHTTALHDLVAGGDDSAAIRVDSAKKKTHTFLPTLLRYTTPIADQKKVPFSPLRRYLHSYHSKTFVRVQLYRSINSLKLWPLDINKQIIRRIIYR